MARAGLTASRIEGMLSWQYLPIKAIQEPCSESCLDLSHALTLSLPLSLSLSKLSQSQVLNPSSNFSWVLHTFLLRIYSVFSTMNSLGKTHFEFLKTTFIGFFLYKRFFAYTMFSFSRSSVLSFYFHEFSRQPNNCCYMFSSWYLRLL